MFERLEFSAIEEYNNLIKFLLIRNFILKIYSKCDIIIIIKAFI